MNDLEREQSDARSGLWFGLFTASGIFLSTAPEWEQSKGWFFFNFMVIAGCLIMAAIHAMQLRLLKKAEDGVTAQAYLSIGRAKPRPSWPLRVAMFLAMLLIVVFFLATGIEPERTPWWLFAVLAVALLWGVVTEVRRLGAMSRPPATAASQESTTHAQPKDVGDR